MNSVRDVDWASWVPGVRAALCYVIDRDSVLLIEKKKGFGAGKVNAPGGHIEAGEDPAAAAVRETIEETRITPSRLSYAADLSFAFTDGFGLHADVFVSRSFSGRIGETDEAVPFWCPLDRLPWDRMWEDDPVWLPAVLEGRMVTGRFIIDGERMRDHLVSIG